MAHVVGDTITDIIEPRDTSGTLISGIAASLQSNLYTRKPGGASFVATIAEIGSTGRYEITLPSSEAGNGFYWSTSYSSPHQVHWDTYDVLTAAQADPAAALAATSSAVATIAGRVDVAVSSRADASEWTPTRAAKVDRLGIAQVLVSSPTANAERITIRKGDTYSVALGNPLEWDYDGPVDLSDAGSVTLTMRSRSVEVEQACSVTNPGQPVQTIVAELTGTQTDELLQKEVTSYDITAVFAGSNNVTLFEGKCRVMPDQSP